MLSGWRTLMAPVIALCILAAITAGLSAGIPEREHRVEVIGDHPPTPETDLTGVFEHTDASDGKTDIGLDLGDREQLLAARAASAPIVTASQSAGCCPAGDDSWKGTAAGESATEITLHELEAVLAQIVGILDQLDMLDEADFTP